MATELITPRDLPNPLRDKLNALLRERHSTLSVQTTGVGTDAATTEKDLLTHTLPADTLDTDGQGVRIRVWGTTAANANTKHARVYWGGIVVADTTALAANDRDWFVEVVIFRTGSAAQDIFIPIFMFGNFIGTTSQFQTDTEDLTTDTIIKVTGQNGTATANDLVAEGMSIEFLPAA